MEAFKMTTKSLWPEIKESLVRSPASILREQADALSDVTNNILKGAVHHFPAFIKTYEILDMEDNVEHQECIEKNDSYGESRLAGFSLDIVAPKLNNYRFTVLTIAYDPLQIYPVYLSSNILMKEQKQYARTAANQFCNETDFTEAFEKILRSERVKEIISNLVAQSSEPDLDWACK
jgi:hypothetical protein